MEYKESLYPELPTAPPIQDGGKAYRLHKISEIQKTLEDERTKRETLSKKYHRGAKIVNNVDTVLVATSMGLGIAGAGLLSTVVAAPVVLALEGVALGTGLLSIIGKQVNKNFGSKAEKHEKIKVLAEAKLNTISDHISKALMDNEISDEEFKLILDELAKFREMKDELRSKSNKNIDSEMKKSLIQQGRQEAHESFRKLFEENKIANQN